MSAQGDIHIDVSLGLPGRRPQARPGGRPRPPRRAPSRPRRPQARPARATEARRRTAAARTPDPVGELRFQVTLRRRRHGDRLVHGVQRARRRVRRLRRTRRAASNDFVHKFRGGPSTRTSCSSAASPTRTRCWPGSSTVPGPRRAQGHHVSAARPRRQARAHLAFAGAFPVKWHGPALNAESTNVATETLEIAHHGFMPGSS